MKRRNFDEDVANLGLHAVVGLSSTSLSREEGRLLELLQPTGIILFKHNVDAAPGVDWVAKFKTLVTDARSTSSRPEFMVSIDHECGRVFRLKDPITNFGPARTWRQHSREVGTAVGKELRYLGINFNYAPVLDVLSEPRNKVIGDRAFSDTADEVSQFALQYFQAMESEGIVGCGKHFPGHGGTVEDSHETLPILNASLDTIRHRDLKPFVTLIQAGIRAILTSHVIYPAIDSALPATLSSAIIVNLLRKELGFTGVVISDALDMGALSGFVATEVGAHFIKAGGDLLCVAQPKNVSLPAEHGLKLIEGILDSLHRGDITALNREESANRIKDFLNYITEVSASRSGGLDKNLHLALAQAIKAETSR